MLWFLLVLYFYFNCVIALLVDFWCINSCVASILMYNISMLWHESHPSYTRYLSKFWFSFCLCCLTMIYLFFIMWNVTVSSQGKSDDYLSLVEIWRPSLLSWDLTTVSTAGKCGLFYIQPKYTVNISVQYLLMSSQYRWHVI